MHFVESRNSCYCSIYGFSHLIFTAAWCFILASCSTEQEVKFSHSESITRTYENALNINTASAAELEKIPHIGEKLAVKIVEHRERHGNFRKPEQLMLIPGISDQMFREIRPMIRVD